MYKLIGVVMDPIANVWYFILFLSGGCWLILFIDWNNHGSSHFRSWLCPILSI